jgi:hypothetical protein
MCSQCPMVLEKSACVIGLCCTSRHDGPRPWWIARTDRTRIADQGPVLNDAARSSACASQFSTAGHRGLHHIDQCDLPSRSTKNRQHMHCSIATQMPRAFRISCPYMESASSVAVTVAFVAMVLCCRFRRYVYRSLLSCQSLMPLLPLSTLLRLQS